MKGLYKMFTYDPRFYYIDGDYIYEKFKAWYKHKNDLKSYDTQIKLYKNGVIKIKHYKEPIILNAHAKINRSDNGNIQRQNEVNNLTKTRIYDLAMQNEFNFFITLTFNSEVIDRYNFKETSKKVRKFMNNYSRIDPEYKYLIVYETHKDGAWHYHGLIYIKNESVLKDSGHKDKKGNIIYNWRKWNYGFSTVTKINNNERVARYIMKYITKQPRFTKGLRKYYHSNNLEMPIIIKDNIHNLNMFKFDDKKYETEISIGYEYNINDK